MVSLEQGGVSVLVLQRKPNEKIRIGNDITIVILRLDGAKVFVGIDAPKEISVHRQEVWEKIERERDGDSVGKYYCDEHKYNPPRNSGFAFCPKCEFPEES